MFSGIENANLDIVFSFLLIFNNVFTDQDACLMKFLLKFLVIYSFPKYSSPRPLLTIPGAYGYRYTLLVFFMSMFGWICYFIKCRKFDHHGSSLHLDRTFYRHHDRCPPDLVVTRPPQSEWPQLVFTLCQGTFTHKWTFLPQLNYKISVTNPVTFYCYSHKTSNFLKLVQWKWTDNSSSFPSSLACFQECLKFKRKHKFNWLYGRFNDIFYTMWPTGIQLKARSY